MQASAGDDSDTTIIVSNAESGEEEEEADDSPVVKWSLTEANRPVQYVPVCRNSQLILMNKLTMKHLWSEATQLMKMLLTDARHPPLIVFRYGMLVLQHYAPADDESFRQYYQETMSPFVMRFLSRKRREKNKISRAILMNINKKEIILDASAVLFQHHCDEEIVELFEWFRNHGTGHSKFHDRKYKNRIVEACYSGYEAYMRFLKWRKQQKHSTLSHHEEEEQETNEFSDQDQGTIDLLMSVVKSSADFSVDLFLSSLLEMYESKEKYEDAVSVTRYHSAKRVNDLNAHLRHYDMIIKRINQVKESDENSDADLKLEDMRINCFCCIARLSPAHTLVRDVCDSEDPVMGSEIRGAGTDEDLTTRIRLLMNFLDHRANMRDVTGWQALSALLEELSQTDQRAYRTFMRFFNNRVSDYWECVHFNPDHISRDDSSVTQSKIAIVSLAGVCSKYRKAIAKDQSGRS